MKNSTALMKLAKEVPSRAESVSRLQSMITTRLSELTCEDMAMLRDQKGISVFIAVE